MSGATSAVAISTGMQMVGGLMQGNQAAGAANYNAAVARQNAAITQQQGAAAVEALQRKQYQQIGSMVAGYGASGVSGGSALDVVGQSAAMAALDRLTLKYNYDLKAMGYDNTANLDEAQADNARTSAILGAIGTGIKGYGTYEYMGGGSNGGSNLPWQDSWGW